jgi:hypothetical protein
MATATKAPVKRKAPAKRKLVDNPAHVRYHEAKAAGVKTYVNVFLPAIVLGTLKALSDKTNRTMTDLFAEVLAKKDIPTTAPKVWKTVDAEYCREPYRVLMLPSLKEDLRAAMIKLTGIPKDRKHVNWSILAEHMMLAYFAKKKIKLVEYSGSLPTKRAAKAAK